MSSSRPGSFAHRLLVSARLAVSALLVSACSSPRENVAEKTADWQAHARDEVARIESRGKVTFTWAQARAELLRINPALRKARSAMLTADNQIDRVWLDLLPVTSLTYSIDRGLTDMARSGNGQFSLYAFINIPGVIGTRMRYYAAVLGKVRAGYAYELAVREQTLALWNLFRDKRRIDERRAWARYARSRNLLVSTTGGGNAALSEYLSDYALRREDDSLQDRAAQLFGDYGREYVLDDHDLPRPDYLASPLDFRDIRRSGLLAMKLTATELEGARLQLLGATLAFWPDVSVGISGPPVYSDGPGGSSFWRARDARVNANVAWQLDTNLSRVYSLYETKRQVALIHSQIDLANQERIRKLIVSSDMILALKKRAANVDRRLAAVMAEPPRTDFAGFSTWSNELRTLIAERDQLHSESDMLNAVFWFVDESKWPQPDATKYDEPDEKENERLRHFIDDKE